MTAERSAPADAGPTAWRRRLTFRARSHPTMLAVGGGNVTVLLLGLVSGVLASRVLGPSLRGELVAGQTWAAVSAVVLSLGVAQAVVTFRGDDRELPGPLILQAAASLLIASALFALLARTGQPWMSPAGVAGGAALTTSALLNSLAAGYAQRQGRMVGAFQAVRLIPQATGVLAAVVVWQCGSLDPNVWLLAIGLGFFLPSVAAFVAVLGGLQVVRRHWRPHLPRALCRAAASSLVVVLAVQVIYRLDSLAVAAFLPPEQIALYAVAVTAAVACSAIGQTVGMVTFSRLRTVTDPHRQRVMLRRGTAQALAVTAAVAIPVAATAPWLIDFLYGAAFVPAGGPTRLLVIAAIPLAADYLLQHVLLSLSGSRRALRVQLVAAAVSIGLLAAAISGGNLEWVATVSIVVYTLSAAMLYRAAMHRIRVNADRPSIAR